MRPLARWLFVALSTLALVVFVVAGLGVMTMTLFFALLTVAANVVVIVVAATAALAKLAPGARPAWASLREVAQANALPVAWLVAAVATIGSLYYSRVAHFVPCEFCWYQRIAMYPLAIILGVAVLRDDASVWRFGLPLAAIGGLLSIYHYQLERFPQQGGVSCSADAPCNVTLVWEFHYISIPFMALSAFALIAVALLLVRSGADVPEVMESRT